MIGQRLGHFEIIRELGRGGMGVVYEALDTRLSRRCALKVLLPNFVDIEMLQRFDFEAKALASVHHPGVVRVYTYGQIDQVNTITMEFLPDGSLQQRLNRQPITELTQGLNWLIQIATALKVIHEKGVIHRDLKPDNILCRGEQLCLSDFGLAKHMSAQTQLTATGVVVGTPDFMAPEQIEPSFGKPGPQTDLFALGVIAYLMFTGEKPFANDSVTTTFSAILTGKRPNIRDFEVATDLPDSLIDVIDSCLEIDVNKRCSSAVELLQRLKNIELELNGRIKEERSTAFHILLGASLCVVLSIGTHFAVRELQSGARIEAVRQLNNDKTQIAQLKSEVAATKKVRAAFDLVQAELSLRESRMQARQWGFVEQMRLILRVEPIMPDLSQLKACNSPELEDSVLTQRLKVAKLCAGYATNDRNHAVALLRLTDFCGRSDLDALWKNTGNRRIRLLTQTLRLLRRLYVGVPEEVAEECLPLKQLLDQEKTLAVDQCMTDKELALLELCCRIATYESEHVKFRTKMKLTDLESFLAQILKSWKRFSEGDFYEIHLALIEFLYHNYVVIYDFYALNKSKDRALLIEQFRDHAELKLDQLVQQSNLSVAQQLDLKLFVVERFSNRPTVRFKALKKIQSERFEYCFLAVEQLESFLYLANHNWATTSKNDSLLQAFSGLSKLIHETKRLNTWQDCHLLPLYLLRFWLSASVIVGWADYEPVESLADDYFYYLKSLPFSERGMAVAKDQYTFAKLVVERYQGNNPGKSIDELLELGGRSDSSLQCSLDHLFLTSFSYSSGQKIQGPVSDFRDRVEQASLNLIHKIESKCLSIQVQYSSIAPDVCVIRAVFTYVKQLIDNLKNARARFQQLVRSNGKPESTLKNSILNLQIEILEFTRILRKLVNDYTARQAHDAPYFQSQIRTLEQSNRKISAFVRTEVERQ